MRVELDLGYRRAFSCKRICFRSGGGYSGPYLRFLYKTSLFSYKTEGRVTMMLKLVVWQCGVSSRDFGWCDYNASVFKKCQFVMFGVCTVLLKVI